MRTIQRSKRTELIPAGIQLAPFFIIGIFRLCSVPLFLSCHITILYTKTANIHCPIRYAAHRKIQPGRNLRFHVFPTCTDISTPCSRRITLQSGKSRTGQQKHTFVIIHSALTVVNRFRIHQCISIEEFCRRAQCRRPAQSLPIFQVCTVAHIRFAGIHPPGIDT